MVVKNEESILHTKGLSQEESCRAPQAYTAANPGSHRRQSRSNTSPGVVGARLVSRIEKKAGKRRATNNDHNNPGEYSGRKRGPSSKGSEDEAGNSLRLACPFFKRDRAKHFTCLHFQLKRAKDVKQHILRKHQFHCPTCFAIFPDMQKCEEHMDPRVCQPGHWLEDYARANSISEAQKLELSSRATIGRTDKEQWFSVWETLFPDVEPPSDPYLRSEVEEGILMVRELLVSNGPLALENLSPTVSFRDGALNSMLASCSITNGPLDVNAAGSTIAEVDSILDSLSRVIVVNPEMRSPSPVFWGAELSPSHPWEPTDQLELPPPSEVNSEPFCQTGAWDQTPRVTAVQTPLEIPQPSPEMEALSRSPPQLSLESQQQLSEAIDTQMEGLIGIDDVFPNANRDDDQCSSAWDDYIVGDLDLSFVGEQVFNDGRF